MSRLRRHNAASRESIARQSNGIRSFQAVVRGAQQRRGNEDASKEALSTLHRDMNPHIKLMKEVVLRDEEQHPDGTPKYPKGINEMIDLSSERSARIGIGRHHFWSDWTGEEAAKKGTSGRSRGSSVDLHEATGDDYGQFHGQVRPADKDAVVSDAEQGTGVMMSMMELHKNALDHIREHLNQKLFDQRMDEIDAGVDQGNPVEVRSGPNKGAKLSKFKRSDWDEIQKNPLHATVWAAFSEDQPPYNIFKNAWGDSSAQFARFGAHALLPGDSHGATAHTDFSETIQAREELKAYSMGVEEKVDEKPGRFDPGTDMMTVGRAARLAKIAALPGKQYAKPKAARDGTAVAASNQRFAHADGMTAAGSAFKASAREIVFDRAAYKHLHPMETHGDPAEGLPPGPKMTKGRDGRFTKARDQRTTEQKRFAADFDTKSSEATEAMEKSRGSLLAHMRALNPE